MNRNQLRIGSEQAAESLVEMAASCSSGGIIQRFLALTRSLVAFCREHFELFFLPQVIKEAEAMGGGGRWLPACWLANELFLLV